MPKKKTVQRKVSNPKKVNKQKITVSELKTKIYDIDTPDSVIRDYLKLNNDSTNAFAPIVEINPELVEAKGQEADVAVGVLNSLSRWRRQKRYRRKIKRGFKGIRIVSEGDSWFQYPWLIEDVIDNLFDEYAIFSLGAAGDTLEEMLLKDEFSHAIEEEKPHIFLISAGGNDIFGDGRLATLVNAQQNGAIGYLNRNFDTLLDGLIAKYRQLFGELQNNFPSLKVIGHGYDYAIPNNGPWLGKPLLKAGVKGVDAQRKVLIEIVNRFSDAFKEASADFSNVYLVDCRNAVTPDLWCDELHPTNEGFAAVANRFKTLISSLSPTRSEVNPTSNCPGRERMVKNTTQLPDDLMQRLTARRGRAIGIDFKEEDPQTSRLKTDSLEGKISQFFEKIDQGADFLPARFLEDGASKSRAVCRIQTPSGLGTGFLIASRSFIMTNNHVISSSEEAQNSAAEFRFQQGSTPIMVALRPEKFFITDDPLDFTIVACDDAAVPEDAVPIELLRNPATVSKKELVNIIQHPRGRLKEVALHHNEVHDLLDKVIHYRTDTEPGSSGSPVFNNEWELVALHHAGWTTPGNRATNEGIRISAIVAKLIAIQSRSGQNESLNRITELVQDTSPYLGFFDIAGVADSNSEIEIPDFRGTPDFADVGFWNIEHFNRHVGQDRIRKIADVINRMSMDALGLTEVEQGALDKLCESLRDKGNNVDFVLKNVPGSQDIAVLFDRDTTEVNIENAISDRNRDLLRVETPGGKSAFPREPLFARCKVSDEASPSGVEFIMIVVHLKAFGDATSRARRRLASESLALIIEDIRDKERLPIVLGGDFNESINTDVLSALTQAPDLVSLTTDDADAGAASYIGGSRRSLIDHIIVSSDVKPGSIQGDDAAILRLDKSVSNFSSEVSDHVPVILRIVNRSAPVDVPPSRFVPDGAIVGEFDNGQATIALPKSVNLLTVHLSDSD